MAELENEALTFITEAVENVEKANEGATLIVAQNLSETLEYRSDDRRVGEGW